MKAVIEVKFCNTPLDGSEKQVRGGGKHAIVLNCLLSTGTVKMSLAGVEGYQLIF